MIGLAVGIAAGATQYWLLSKFTAHMTGGKVTPAAVLLGILQFFLPIGVLVAMAFIKQSDLILTAAGITGSLIICAVVKNILNTRKTRGREDNND